jgi:hypothetical protein
LSPEEAKKRQRREDRRRRAVKPRLRKKAVCAGKGRKKTRQGLSGDEAMALALAGKEGGVEIQQEILRAYYILRHQSSTVPASPGREPQPSAAP